MQLHLLFGMGVCQKVKGTGRPDKGECSSEPEEGPTFSEWPSCKLGRIIIASPDKSERGWRCRLMPPN